MTEGKYLYILFPKEYFSQSSTSENFQSKDYLEWISSFPKHLSKSKSKMT